MKKIPTLFERDPDNRKHVISVVKPECQWVIDGEGVATRKFDGTCVMYSHVHAADVSNGWYCRREVKPGKDIPTMFIQEDVDNVTGKIVGWEPAEQSSFYPWLQEAIENTFGDRSIPVGTYELCGPKINNNPENYPRHVLVPHGLEKLDVPRDFEGLKDWLNKTEYEGIVWHHPDGRRCKLKKRDF